MRDGPAGRPGPDRRHPGARRSGGLPPGARGAGRPVPAAGQDRGSPRLLPAGARPRPAGAGAAVPRAAAGRAQVLGVSLLLPPLAGEGWDGGRKHRGARPPPQPSSASYGRKGGCTSARRGQARGHHPARTSEPPLGVCLHVDLGPARSTKHGKETRMCPVCLTTAALAAAGVTSAGGLTTLVVKKLRAGRPSPATGPRNARSCEWIAQESYREMSGLPPAGGIWDRERGTHPPARPAERGAAQPALCRGGQALPVRRAERRRVAGRICSPARAS